MKISNQVVKNIISRVIKSQDYRIEIVNILNSEFLIFSIDFFKRVVEAKMNSETITIDWYKKYFLDEKLGPDEFAIHAGLNKKAIQNMYGTTQKNVVIDVSLEHFEALYNSVCLLVDNEKDALELTLTIKFKGVSVDLSINESLVVINTLAVKRSQLRGGLWSSAGKRVEKYLMQALCHLYDVPKEYYISEQFIKDRTKKVDREIDFYLKNENQTFLCEVKLMGKGNPESADAIIARGTNVFIADTLSEQNKNQCDQLGIHWIALREEKGYAKFADILSKLSIPHTPYDGKLDNDLDSILDRLLN